MATKKKKYSLPAAYAKPTYTKPSYPNLVSVPRQVRNWSDYQKAIFQDVATGTGHTVVVARAGSAKTTSIIESFYHLPKGLKTLMVAFNKNIQEELKSKAPPGVDVLTLHSLGYRALLAKYGSIKPNMDKGYDISKSILGDDYEMLDAVQSLTKLVSLCKGNLAHTEEDIESIIDTYGIDIGGFEVTRFINYTLEALELHKKQNKNIDFDDMIWFPIIFNMTVGKWDRVFVDECLPYETPVLLADGTSKSIGDIVENNLDVNVLAYDTETKTQKVCKVIGRRKILNNKPLVKINSFTKSVICTIDHKIWANETWIQAGKIESGMKIVSSYPLNNTVISVDPASINDYYVYDLEVEDCHNFYANGILVHNCQDLNPAQIKLAMSACKPDGRVTAVGDNFQSIYQFRGADSQAIPNIIETLKAKTLPLSVSYRCAASIIKEAQTIVPDIEEAPNAKEGQVLKTTKNKIPELAKPGDFILSRVNAPLIGICLSFIKNGIAANIQGKDIGKNLLAVIKRSKAKTIDKLLEYTTAWRDKESQRMLIKKRSPDSVIDKAECIFALCENAKSINDVKSNLDRLFNDVDDKNKVILSTVHKAKGLERDTVFMLMGTFRVGKSDEENNLYYVAVTRAINTLYKVY